jgi:lipopolysaccharide transport system ATP-binding protein
LIQQDAIAMPETAVRVEGLSKQYRVPARRASYWTLRDTLAHAAAAPLRWALGRTTSAPAPPDDRIWARKDVSFEIRRGEVVGIIGPNGAGKSTLLRILSRITEPTSGYAEVRGRVGALLEVGSGFHGELTGRENVYLSGSILGMPRAEIRRKFEQIVSFAGVDRFIDTPVKHYSSGMYIRLAFAVAAHLEPEILIVDETLAVGDAAFQRKCLEKMGELAREGRTVLLVTHNMGVISRLTQRTMLLEQGQIRFFGDTPKAVSAYLHSEARQGGLQDLRQHANRPQGMTPTLVSARITDAAGREKQIFQTGEDWFLEVDYAGDGKVRLAGVAYDIWTATGTFVTRFETYMRGAPPYRIPQRGTVRFHVLDLPLLEGDYMINLGIGADPRYFYDSVPAALSFSVQKSDPYESGFLLTREHGICSFKGSFELLPPSRRPRERRLPDSSQSGSGTLDRRRRGVVYLPVIQPGGSNDRRARS